MREIKWHFIFWFAYFLFAYLSDLVVDIGTTLPIELIIFATNNIYLFYSIYFLLKNFSFRSPPSVLRSLAYAVLTITFFFAIRYCVRYQLLAKFADPDFGAIPLKEWLVSSLLWIVNYFFYASAYLYFQLSVKKQKQLNEYYKERSEEEKKRLQLENALLRSQINPHFLYNTLNFLYAKSLLFSKEVSDGIMQLSEIMQYSLRPQDADGHVILSEELEHIDNLVALARLRFGSNFFLEFNKDLFDSNVRVIPLVYLTLVENVFKHGELRDASSPAKIFIATGIDNTIVFRSHNRKGRVGNEKKSGLGLANIKARLEEAYRDTFQLEVKQDETEFSVLLIVPLSKSPSAQQNHLDFRQNKICPTPERI